MATEEMSLDELALDAIWVQAKATGCRIADVSWPETYPGRREREAYRIALDEFARLTRSDDRAHLASRSGV